MVRQSTGWGYIDWLEANPNDKKAVLSVGIVVIDPHAHMPAHIHFDEQIIYTLQGHGYSLLNGRRLDMSVYENSLLHWMPGVIHEMYNLGDEPYIHLMVTCSVSFEEEVHTEESNYSNFNFQESLRCLYEVLDELKDSFLNTLRYSFVIYDALGNVAATSKLFPQYCRKYCGKTIRDHSSFCMQKQNYPSADKDSSFVCPGGLTVLSVPIVFQGKKIGLVEGGYVYTGDGADSGDHDASEQELYMAPISSVKNVQIMLKRLARMLSHYCELKWYRIDIENQEQRLDFAQRDLELLEASLKQTESSMIDLKINNHFLFNTLNQMAAMALEGGEEPLYRSIVDLSKMFQYTLKNDQPMVTLAQELDYLDSYLKLQKLRYGENLKVMRDIKVDPDKWQVPFNWMMPLVENAFIHGFHETRDKKIRISIDEENEWLEVEIQNNGIVLEAAALKALRIRMRGAEPHGMPMIFQKMKNCYGDEFIMDIQATEEGTKVCIMLPRKTNA